MLSQVKTVYYFIIYDWDLSFDFNEWIEIILKDWETNDDYCKE